MIKEFELKWKRFLTNISESNFHYKRHNKKILAKIDFAKDF